ncbi:MAG: hypothetical protein KF856_17570 [Cyclobacteriaceae bacterium]|nr:hypothetical protein [Cyclobacteriaceae bacterium]
MAKENNIVHQYFKKEMPDGKILLRVNPIQFKGTEIWVGKQGAEMRTLDFDAEIFEDLEEDGFVEVNPMEFNLYLSGLIE